MNNKLIQQLNQFFIFNLMSIDIDIDNISTNFNSDNLILILYILSTIIYAASIYIAINFVLSIPVLLYLMYRFTDLNIPHLDVIAILYGLVLSMISPYLLIPFSISISLLILYSCKDIDY